MKPRHDDSLLENLRALAELYGKSLSLAAASLFLAALERFQSHEVSQALAEHMRESKQFPTVAEIITRIEARDGRPGPEEAWSLVPKSEDESAVITDEMAVAMTSLIRGDEVASRMAFKESYIAQVRDARAAKKPVRWFASLGHNPRLRESAVRHALEKSRLTIGEALNLIPDMSVDLPGNRQIVSGHDHSKRIREIAHAVTKSLDAGPS